MSFTASFEITPKIVDSLMRVAALRENIAGLGFSPDVMKILRAEARLKAVYWSAVLSGTPLSLDEAERIMKRGGNFSVRERREREISGYSAAVEWLENNSERPITENSLRKINAIFLGADVSRVTPSPYRNGTIAGQTDEAARREPTDTRQIPSLMGDLISWLARSEGEIPAPLAAAIVHHEIARIRPFNSGNIATARLAATLVLYRGGFGLNGFYALEEYYGADPKKYNETLNGGVSAWIVYFISGIEHAFEVVKERTEKETASGAPGKSALFRALSPRQRKILALFADSDTIASKDVEALLAFSARSARLLCQKLAKGGFLEADNKADKTRTYKLGEKFKSICG
jgi:Fic family protein